MSVDKAKNLAGEVDTSKPLCIPDPIVQKDLPSYLKIGHNDRVVSVARMLNFHEDQVVTEVSDRTVRTNTHCVIPEFL